MTVGVTFIIIVIIIIVVSGYSTHDCILIIRWLHDPIHATIIETTIAILVEYIVSVIQHTRVRLNIIIVVVISSDITILAILSTISTIIVTIVIHLIWQSLLLLLTTTIVTKIIEVSI